MYHSKTTWATVLALAVVVTAGCAKVPTPEIETSDRSMESAREAGAAEYAPESMTAAQDARAKLDTELKAQEEKSAIFRSYDKALELAAASTAASEKAEKDAIEGRNRTREEAAALIAEVRTDLAEVKRMLEHAPTGKGSEVDLAVLRTDVTGVEQAVAAVDESFAAERYLEAKTRAQVAKDDAARIETEIARAMEVSKKRTGQRG